MRSRAFRIVAAFALPGMCVGAAGCKGGGGDKEVAQVTISYRATPTTALPRGMSTVAVLDAETTDEAEKKWSEMSATMISGLLDRAARKEGVKLTVADRQNLKKVMAEKDMAAAGLVDGAKASQMGKVLGVQGMIASAINVKVEKHKGKGRTIDAMSIAAWRYGGSGAVKSEEIDKVTRNITVQCHFRLLDSNTGKVVIDHVSPTLRQMEKTKTSPFFGASKTEAELTPRDQIIGTLVEKEVRRFIGQFVPIEIEETIEVQSSGNDACRAGVRFLVASEYDEAIGMFKQAIAEAKDGQDEYAVFGMGVACEAKGDLDQALNHYRTAVRLDSPGAERAMKRVKARMADSGDK